MRMLLILCLVLLAGPADADVIGEARVIDGDTVAIGDVRVRLHGIDAPERGQACGDDAIGSAATRYLRSLITGPVLCIGSERDRYGRLIAVCYSSGRELNAEMVRAGHAWAYLKYSRDYEGLQRVMSCEPPWEWRRR